MSEVPPNIDDPQDRDELGSEPPLHSLPITANIFALCGDGIVVLTERVDAEPPADFDVWLHVGAGGLITLATGKAEVGQNIRSAFAQTVAEEIGMPHDLVTVLLADTDLCPFDIGTFGSRSTPITVPQVRRAAAQVRSEIVKIRSARGIDDARREIAPDELAELLLGTRQTVIVHTDDSAPPALGPTGLPWPKVDGRAFVTGRHRYTFDLVRPGMLFGAVLRPPSFEAKVISVDTSRARSLPGTDVLHVGGLVGVVARSREAAVRAAETIDATWTAPRPGASDELPSLLRPTPIIFDPPMGEVADGATVEAVYTASFIAHTPLEPRAAVAEWAGDRVTVWTGTQRPFGVREELATALDVPVGQVRVIVPDTGSGYGGKHTGDAAVEAAHLSRACGKPVKVVWSREDEFRYAYFRPGAVIDVRASVTPDGRIFDWQFHNTNSGTAAIQTPYNVGRSRVEFHEADSPLRQGSYRALAATANNFARECHIDDLARACGIDPVDFRVRNIIDQRLAAVVCGCAERFGWSRADRVYGRGYGIACGIEKGSYIATAVEIEVDSDRRPVLRRIVAAYDCGAIVNRMHLENQVEGAIVMGIGGALFERIRFDCGRIVNPRLSAYRVPRFADIPPIEVVLAEPHGAKSVGAGETPIIAIAPAISNALVDACGVRLRNLPMTADGTVPLASE